MQGEESSRAGGEANGGAEAVDLYGPDNEEYTRTQLVSPYPVPKLKVPEGVSRRFAARSGGPQQGGGGGGYRDRGEEDRYQRSNRSEYEHHPRPPFRDHREGGHQGYADHQPPYASHKRSRYALLYLLRDVNNTTLLLLLCAVQPRRHTNDRRRRSVQTTTHRLRRGRAHARPPGATPPATAAVPPAATTST